MMLTMFLWLSTTLFIGSTQGKGSNPMLRYSAVRYGNYYSTVYYSYSGGKGFARYSRVYSREKNHYPGLYNYMFDWLKTEQFKVYKNTPSGSISVCKNYEANENGTYLGIFTCPLPFVPKDHAYCCGLTNAQYCCRFWDIPLNFAAAFLGILMGVLLFVTSIYVTIQLCINHRKTNEKIKQRKAVRRIGLLRRCGRRVSSGSLWARALFDRVHAESTFSESRDIEDEEDTEHKNKKIQNDVINTMKSLVYNKSKNDDVTNTVKLDENDARVCKEMDKLAPPTKVERHDSSESGFIEGASAFLEQVEETTASMAIVSSWTEKRGTGDGLRPGDALKPLRVSPRISFNGSLNQKTSLASKYH